MPGNVRIGVELPLGVILICVLLFSTAIVNLFTKELATIGGVTFSIVFFVIFTISEQKTAAGSPASPNWNNSTCPRTAVQREDMKVRPGNILVAVRDPRNLNYLRRVLAKTDTTKPDVVVMTARVYHREHSFSGSEEVDTAEVFEEYERELFTAVVSLAEKEGKHVSLLVVPTNDVFDAIVQRRSACTPR